MGDLLNNTALLSMLLNQGGSGGNIWGQGQQQNGINQLLSLLGLGGGSPVKDNNMGPMSPARQILSQIQIPDYIARGVVSPEQYIDSLLAQGRTPQEIISAFGGTPARQAPAPAPTSPMAPMVPPGTVTAGYGQAGARSRPRTPPPRGSVGAVADPTIPRGFPAGTTWDQAPDPYSVWANTSGLGKEAYWADRYGNTNAARFGNPWAGNTYVGYGAGTPRGDYWNNLYGGENGLGAIYNRTPNSQGRIPTTASYVPGGPPSPPTPPRTRYDLPTQWGTQRRTGGWY